MKLAVCVEQYDVVGVLPSQLESIALLNSAMGITEAAFIDCTLDGFPNPGGFSLYNNYADFFSIETGPFIAFSPTSGEDIRTISIPDNSWLVFGPSMGWGNVLDGVTVTYCTVPGGTMNSRDVIPIALWETSSWREQ